MYDIIISALYKSLGDFICKTVCFVSVYLSKIGYASYLRKKDEYERSVLSLFLNQDKQKDFFADKTRNVEGIETARNLFRCISKFGILISALTYSAEGVEPYVKLKFYVMYIYAPALYTLILDFVIIYFKNQNQKLRNRIDNFGI